MKITYDPEADALQFIFHTDRPWACGRQIEEGVVGDLDGDGHIVGLEILDATKRFGGDPLDCISIVRLNEYTCPDDDEAASS